MNELKTVVKSSIHNYRKFYIPFLLASFILETIIAVANSIWIPFVNNYQFYFFWLGSDYVSGVIEVMLKVVLFPIGLTIYCLIIETNDKSWRSIVNICKRMNFNTTRILIFGFLWYISIFLGLEILAFPGVFILIALLFVGPIMNKNKTSYFSAMKRSFLLVQPRFWNVVIIFLVSQIVQGALTLKVSEWLKGTGFLNNTHVNVWVISCFLSLIVYIPISNLYLKREKDYCIKPARTLKVSI